MDVNIEPSWKAELQEEFDKPYFAEIVQFLKKEKKRARPFIRRGHLFLMHLRLLLR